MTSALNNQSLDQIFRSAHTPNGWTDCPVEDRTVRDIYDLLKWGPTSANSSPARFVWVSSAEGKAKLAALAIDQNRPKILAAPVTVIIGYDLAFPETMPKLFPARGEMMRHATVACREGISLLRRGRWVSIVVRCPASIMRPLTRRSSRVREYCQTSFAVSDMARWARLTRATLG